MASNDEEYRSRGQQSPLASQRQQQAGSVPPQAPNGRGFNGYFPLGYKEGFSQWVRLLPSTIICTHELTTSSGQVYHRQ